MKKSKKEEKNLEELLDEWAVLPPGQWENPIGPKDWFAVCNEQGIVAYFFREREAFRFRLAEINRALNG